MSCPHSPFTHDAGSCPSVRPELEALPTRMRKLSVDHRGYPVPWFVLWLPDGTPDHRAISREKWLQATKDGLCWVCGEPLGRFKTFVLGPMCGVNRTTSEPACHLDCAEWSARNCPFLSRPQMVRREMDFEQPNYKGLDSAPPGFALERNPGVTLLWTTFNFDVFRVDPSEGACAGLLIHVGAPVALRAYREGRVATRAELDESEGGGIGSLLEMANKEGPDAVSALETAVARFHETLDEFFPQGLS